LIEGRKRKTVLFKKTMRIKSWMLTVNLNKCFY
jgi:hypothetical protein